MKRLLFVIATVALIAAGCDATTTQVTYPEPTGYVVDSANVLNGEAKAALEKQLSDYAKSGGEIAVLTVESTSPLTIEEYGVNLGNKWKVGKKGLDNGAILIIATQDRKVRIEVGSGAEGQLSDSKAGKILDDSVIPYLKTNDWNGGVVSGVNAIQAALPVQPKGEVK